MRESSPIKSDIASSSGATFLLRKTGKQRSSNSLAHVTGTAGLQILLIHRLAQHSVPRQIEDVRGVSTVTTGPTVHELSVGASQSLARMASAAAPSLGPASSKSPTMKSSVFSDYCIDLRGFDAFPSSLSRTSGFIAKTTAVRKALVRCRFNFPVFHARCLLQMKASWLLNVLPRLLLTKSPPIPSNITGNIVSSPRIHKNPRISKYIYVQHARQSAEIASRVG